MKLQVQGSVSGDTVRSGRSQKRKEKEEFGSRISTEKKRGKSVRRLLRRKEEEVGRDRRQRDREGEEVRPGREQGEASAARLNGERKRREQFGRLLRERKDRRVETVGWIVRPAGEWGRW